MPQKIWPETRISGIMFTEQMSLNLNYLLTRTEEMFGINIIQHSRKITSYQLCSMAVEVSWFGDALLQQSLLWFLAARGAWTAQSPPLNTYAKWNKKTEVTHHVSK
ncbi:hypothetical protein AMECASPLE_039262 [Ameca splendens]|uniref:Uncharacterized protein n=1 Tax=Ameca splendens TaxID=208324 RepID=A0ABV1A5X0_9TELE